MRHQTPLFAWLHLSDIHWGADAGAGGARQETVLQYLADDIAKCVFTKVFPKLNALFVTGDLANTASKKDPQEYEKVGAWLTGIAKVAALPRSAIYTIPGNHDVARTSSEDLNQQRLVKLLRLGEEPLDACLEQSQDRAMLGKRLEAYRKGTSAFAKPDSVGPSADIPLWWFHDAKGLAIPLKIFGLNTALLCQEDGEMGQLAVGDTQLRDLASLDRRRTDDIVIVLGHHPFDWLRDEDRVESTVSQCADVYLSGHVHQFKSSSKRAGGVEHGTLEVVAGASYEKESSDHRKRSGLGYSVGALYIEEGKLVARIWPRQWIIGREAFVADPSRTLDNEFYAEHVIRHRSPQPITHEGSVDALRHLSVRMLDQLGKRRTAHPHDLSFGELDEQRLYLAPKLRPFTVRMSKARSISASSCVRDAAKGQSLLILGEPGSGKSLFAYFVQKRLTGRTCLTINLSDFVTRKSGLQADIGWLTLLRVLKRVYRVGPAEVIDGKQIPMNLTFIVDGVDEFVHGTHDLSGLGPFLAKLQRFGATIVTCRLDVYERLLATRLAQVAFDRVLALEEWSFEEFVQYLSKAVESPAKATRLADIVRESDNLRSLVRRPLHARMMLTLNDQSIQSIVSETDLLESFFFALSVSVSAQVSKEAEFAMSVWSDFAWSVFRDGLMTQDRISRDRLDEYIRKSTNPGITARVLDSLIDPSPSAQNAYVSFGHYSFYEFFAARRLCDTILNSDLTTASPDAFSRDLPQRIRHHAVSILRKSDHRRTLNRLEFFFNESKALVHEEAHRRVSLNLLAYLIRGFRREGADLMNRLHSKETDKFVQISLAWALCEADVRTKLDEALSTFAVDSEASSMNRGYLLYYYGDLDLKRPPYLDDDPEVSWQNTRSRVLDMMQSARYQELAASRRAIDVFTFLDTKLLRTEQLNSSEERVLTSQMKVLLGELGPSKAFDILQEYMTKVADLRLPTSA